MRIQVPDTPKKPTLFMRRMLTLFTAFWILLTTVASADCPNGARDATEQEKETAVRVLTALRDAFPAPAGWKVTRDTRPEAPRNFCKGDDVLNLWFTRTLTRVDGMKERTVEYNRRLTEAKRLTPEEQLRVAEIDKEIGELSKQMGVPRSALKKRDLDKDTRAQLEAELKRLGDEMFALRRRRQALANPWLKEGSRKRSYEDALSEATRDLRQDTEIVVKVAMNDVFAPMKDAERIDIPGFQVAYRTTPRQEIPEAFTEGTTAVFFGHGRPRPFGPPGSLEPIIEPGESSKPRTFSISIQADKERARQMMEAMSEPLQALTR